MTKVTLYSRDGIRAWKDRDETYRIKYSYIIKAGEEALASSAL